MLAGTGVAAGRVLGGPGRWGLFAVSLVLLGRAHYVATWKGHGAQWAKVTVWVSTMLAAVFWWSRLI